MFSRSKNWSRSAGANVFAPRARPTSKMGNIRTFYNGHWYQSKKEAIYAMGLDTQLKGKAIKAWKRQIGFKVIVNGAKICTYWADFVITDLNGSERVIDVKPIDYRTGEAITTAVYKLKKRLVEAIYNIKILEE